ncbi:MAG: hypothetical protein EOP21_15445 [Hyphomicrobiales bacterium]|nr:MAG: hypothetical protein EOP21_15445 [Hyphomicrobiales bacterium]
MLAAGKGGSREQQDVVINLGITQTIPEAYVSDGTVRLDLYARLLRARDQQALDELEDEFDDRFGQLPEEVSKLIRLARLRIAANGNGVSRIDAGPRGLALSFAVKPSRKRIDAMLQVCQGEYRDERLVFKLSTENGLQRLSNLENILRQTPSSQSVN